MDTTGKDVRATGEQELPPEQQQQKKKKRPLFGISTCLYLYLFTDDELFIILPVSLLAEDELVRSHLQTLDVPVQVTRDVNPIQVLPARTLSSMYQQLGKSTMLPLFLHCHTLRLAEKIAHIFLNESGLNLKQIVTDSRSFTRAF